jgi:hypothetical protein
VIGQFQDLYRESRRPEPARLLVAVIKAMQWADPHLGPDDVAQGWRPSQNIDPTIMVDAAWAPMFEPLSGDVQRAVTESLLAAWLDKNRQYPVGRYFRVGLSAGSYSLPATYGNISGGKAWESAAQFMAAGVNPELIKQLQKWGTSYTDTAARFQYAPGTSRSKGTASKKEGGD